MGRPEQQVAASDASDNGVAEQSVAASDTGGAVETEAGVSRLDPEASVRPVQSSSAVGWGHRVLLLPALFALTCGIEALLA